MYWGRPPIISGCGSLLCKRPNPLLPFSRQNFDTMALKVIVMNDSLGYNVIEKNHDEVSLK